jgi:xanthine/uracil/vitamin C permease (AzgA family)
VKAVVTATALSSTVASLICGLGANLPVGLSPGMGLNAYLVFSQVRQLATVMLHFCSVMIEMQSLMDR